LVFISPAISLTISQEEIHDAKTGEVQPEKGVPER
jgi:hypothetical protein